MINVAAVIVYLPQLPERIPTHFGVDGEANAWGNRWTIVALPIISLFAYGLLTLVGRVPHRFGYGCRVTEENAPRLYAIVRVMVPLLKAELAWGMCFVTWGVIRVGLGEAAGVGTWSLPVFLAVIFATVGVFVVRLWRAT